MAKAKVKTGRPQIAIDAKQVHDLASVGCKVNEIAILLGCSTDTLNRRFAAELTKGKESLKVSLRRWQLEAARKGNAALLIWLGKQMLGQSDSSMEDDSELIMEFTKHEATPSK